MDGANSVDDNKVCVFGGFSAWPFYRRTAAYVCQPNRYFQDDTGRIGFYSQRTIFGASPRILEVFPEESLDDETVARYCFSVDSTTRHLGLAMAAALQDEGREDWIVQVVPRPPTARADPQTLPEPARLDRRQDPARLRGPPQRAEQHIKVGHRDVEVT